MRCQGRALERYPDSKYYGKLLGGNDIHTDTWTASQVKGEYICSVCPWGKGSWASSKCCKGNRICEGSVANRSMAHSSCTIFNFSTTKIKSIYGMFVTGEGQRTLMAIRLEKKSKKEGWWTNGWIRFQWKGKAESRVALGVLMWANSGATHFKKSEPWKQGFHGKITQLGWISELEMPVGYQVESSVGS